MTIDEKKLANELGTLAREITSLKVEASEKRRNAKAIDDLHASARERVRTIARICKVEY